MNRQGIGKIEYLDYTWNPVTGCEHNCPYCYAERIADRFGGRENTELADLCPERNNIVGSCLKIHELDESLKYKTKSGKLINAPYPFGFDPTFHRYRLSEPQKVKTPSVIGVVYMGDLFGGWVPDEWIREVFAACEKAPQHIYLFLTKNYLHASKFKFQKNWMIGKTVTCDEDSRLFEGDPWSTDITERANHFLSVEPIHGPIPDLPYYAHEYGFKWVVVGAETGNRKGKIVPKREWIEKIVEDCRFRKVPVFMKNSLKSLMGDDFIYFQRWADCMK